MIVASVILVAVGDSVSMAQAPGSPADTILTFQCKDWTSWHKWTQAELGESTADWGDGMEMGYAIVAMQFNQSTLPRDITVGEFRAAMAAKCAAEPGDRLRDVTIWVLTGRMPAPWPRGEVGMEELV